MKKKFHIILILFFCLNAQAQSNAEIEIQLSSNQLNIGENFSITAKVINVKNIQQPVFPTIPGFEKQDVNSSQQTTVVNGRFSSYYKFVQNYKSKKSGTFILKPFIISVGNVTKRHNGTRLKVKKDKGNVYLELSANKNIVYKGEPIRLSLNLWYDKSSAKTMRLGNRTTQNIEKLKQNILSKSVWVEEIAKADLNGKQLKDGSIIYGTRILDMMITPQSVGALRFDTMSLDVIKTYGFKQDNRTYFSSHLDIVVKDLPKNNSKNIVTGVYELDDNITSSSSNTGDELIYTFTLKGEGNLPFLEGPLVIENDSLLITKLDEDLSFDNKKGQMLGEKTFKYSIVPQVAGNYKLKDYFVLDAFDFRKKVIVSLESGKEIKVVGQSMIADNPVTSQEGEKMDVDFKPVQISNDEFVLINQPERLNLITNLLLLLVIGGLGFLIYRDLKSKHAKTS